MTLLDVWSGSTLFARTCLVTLIEVWSRSILFAQTCLSPWQVWSGSTLFAQTCLSPWQKSYLGLHYLPRPVCHPDRSLIWIYSVCPDLSVTLTSLIWVYTVCPDLSVTLTEVWSGSTLFAQTCLSPWQKSDLGLHCLPRPVRHPDRSLIWVYSVCPDLSVTLTEVWSGSTLFAQTCLSPWQKSHLGLHCLPRPVCHPDRSLSGSTLSAQTCPSPWKKSDLGLHCLPRPVRHPDRSLIWVYTVCPDLSVTLTEVWSGSTLCAQTCLSPWQKSDLGLHCVPRPVCHPDRSLIWVYTVCPDLSITLTEVWSGSTLSAQTCLSPWQKSDLGLHCLPRPVCHPDRSLIWVYTVCPDLSVTLTEVWSGSTLCAQTCLSPWQKSDLGLHCVPRPVYHPDRSLIWVYTVCPDLSLTLTGLIWVYTVCPDLSVTLTEVWSGSTLSAQTCPSPWQKSDLGLHCLPRPVYHPDRSLIWVYTVCPDLSVTLTEVWSGSTLSAQTCPSPWQKSDLGLHCLPRPVRLNN